MTAKEALLEKVEEMSEDEAARWLGEISAEEPHQGESVRTAFKRILAAVPEEEFARIPPARDMDEYLYSKPPKQ
ncbi:MAG: hypothetical protein ACRDHF_09915 [Tepidiformaceae bacterium]